MRKFHRPPKWMNRFLEWYCSAEVIDEIQGDLLEQYQKNVAQKGIFMARLKFTIDVVRFFRPSSLKKSGAGMSIFVFARNYIKVAFRVFKKEKAYTLINVVGLMLGIVCSFFIYLWVQDEMKYNQFAKPSAHFVLTNMPDPGQINTWTSTPQPLKAVLDEHYPVITRSAVFSFNQRALFEKGEDYIQSMGVYTTPELFEILNIEFSKGGNSHEPLESILISENLAEQIFGPGWESQEIIGKTIRDSNEQRYQLQGVFRDIPRQSTIQMDFAIPYELRMDQRPWVKYWGNYGERTIVTIDPHYTTEEANEQVKNAIIDHRSDQAGIAEIMLQPFSERYLFNKYRNGTIAGGRIEYVRILTFAAILVLAIACINFMNLTTAKSISRSKESGIRKVLGAHRSYIRMQFLCESMIVVAIASALALTMVFVLLPHFNTLTGKNIPFQFLNFQLAGGYVLFILLIGLISGSYPAIFMSSFSPVKALKGIVKHSQTSIILRKGLMVFQFVVALGMIVGVITIYKQVRYIQNKNLGFEKENIVRFRRGDISTRDQYLSFRNQLLGMPGIQQMTGTQVNPVNVTSSSSDPQWPGKTRDMEVHFKILNTDPDFIPAMKIPMVSGRNFDWALMSDTLNYIINEKAAEIINVPDPVGLDLKFWGQEGRIIGVIQDFHITSLYSEIDPLVIRYSPGASYNILVRLKPGQTITALNSIEQVYSEFNPVNNFEYSFLDTEFDNQHKAELLVKKLIQYFAILSIIICCLGLLGLVALKAEQLTKEIGIRRVLGASLSSLFRLISFDFLRLFTIAAVVAIPTSYYFLADWLNSFAYQIRFSVWIFAGAIATVLMIVVLTISSQTIRISLRNPVNALRNE